MEKIETILCKINFLVKFILGWAILVPLMIAFCLVGGVVVWENPKDLFFQISDEVGLKSFWTKSDLKEAWNCK